MGLNQGDAAPDFTLLDQHGEPFTLSKSLKERKMRHLVYFYPKADTPGCTKQSCHVKESLGDLGRLGTAAVGISPDPPSRQEKFDRKYGLGFPLLSDPGHAVAQAYGVWAEKSMYGKKYWGIVRSSFLVDQDGKILQAWYKVSPDDTVPNALSALATG